MNFFKKFFGISESSSSEINLNISPTLKDFVKNELIPGLDISENYFWSSFEKILNEFSLRNKELLLKRARIQEQINEWHIKNRGLDFNLDDYKNFLFDIGYIYPRSSNFKIKTWNVDPDIRKIAGNAISLPEI